MRLPDHLACLLKPVCGSEATIRTLHGTTGSELGKEYSKAVYCHPAYLTYIQSTLCSVLGWMKHKRIKIAGRNINSLRYADDTTLMAAESEELESLEEGERGE